MPPKKSPASSGGQKSTISSRNQATWGATEYEVMLGVLLNGSISAAQVASIREAIKERTGLERSENSIRIQISKIRKTYAGRFTAKLGGARGRKVKEDEDEELGE